MLSAPETWKRPYLTAEGPVRVSMHSQNNLDVVSWTGHGQDSPVLQCMFVCPPQRWMNRLGRAGADGKRLKYALFRGQTRLSADWKGGCVEPLANFVCIVASNRPLQRQSVMRDTFSSLEVKKVKKNSSFGVSNFCFVFTYRMGRKECQWSIPKFLLADVSSFVVWPWCDLA